MKQPELKTWQSLALGMVIGGSIMTAALLISAPDRKIPLTLIPTNTPSPILVYVTGAVKMPGVVQLVITDRVQTALESAGGATEDADLSLINLAAQISDGQKIIVPRRGENPSAISNANSSSLAETDLKIYLNTASQKELEKLPGIGEEKAKAIIAERDVRGRFQSADELSDIPGITANILNQIRPFLVVE
jgi:competence protein ComEA